MFSANLNNDKNKRALPLCSLINANMISPDVIESAKPVNMKVNDYRVLEERSNNFLKLIQTWKYDFIDIEKSFNKKVEDAEKKINAYANRNKANGARAEDVRAELKMITDASQGVFSLYKELDRYALTMVNAINAFVNNALTHSQNKNK